MQLEGCRCSSLSEMTETDPRNTFTLEERTDFYFGVYEDFDLDAYARLLNSAQSDTYLRVVEMLYTYQRYAKQTGIGGSYRQDMDRFMHLNDAIGDRLMVVFGDRQPTSKMPVFTKTRRVGELHGILLRLNYERHWRFHQFLQEDLRWQDKVSATIWRGAPTGYQREGDNPRLRLVENFGAVLNVGFSQPHAQGLRFDPALVKGKVSIAEQLRHKYLLSIEGNDIATNLKWILASNSVPVMPLPTIDSWLMESRLLPYFHYVPIERDFSNLIEVLNWCRDNDEACHEIAENGKAYMQQFDDVTDEKIEKRLYARFRDLTTTLKPNIAQQADHSLRISELKSGYERDPSRIDQFGDPYFLKELLRLLLAIGSWDEARDLIPACERYGQKNWYEILFARALDTLGRRDEARTHWERFAEGRPRHVEAHLRLRDLPNLAEFPSPFREILSKVPQQKVELIFDVGANKGQSCLPYQQAFPKARIHAFEPVPESFELLCQRIEEGSEGKSDRIVAHNLALSDRAGSLTFTRMGHSTINRVARAGYVGSTQEVEAITLAAFCVAQGIEQIDLLKIDTEGHDLAVLRGCGDMLPRISFIQCEASANQYNTFHNAFTEIFDFLSKRNFYLFGIQGLTYEPANGGYPVLRRFDPIFVNADVVGPLEGVITR